jgi:hypothetical protein
MIVSAVIAAAWLTACAVTAEAAAMRCSGEEKVCVAACGKTANGAALSMCITNCGQRQAYCMKTGCWDSATNRFCGLQRQ